MCIIFYYNHKCEKMAGMLIIFKVVDNYGNDIGKKIEEF